MKNFSDILNRVKGAKVPQYGATLSPERDWSILLALAFVLLCLSAAWNAWTFLRLESGDTLTSISGTSAPTFDSSSLKSVDTLFTARAAQEAHYLSDYHFVDPSS